MTRIVDLFLYVNFEFDMINSIRNQNCQNLWHKLVFGIIRQFHSEIIFQRQKSWMWKIYAAILRMFFFKDPFMPLRFRGMIFLIWMVILHLPEPGRTMVEKTFAVISVYVLLGQPLIIFYPPHEDHLLVSMPVLKTLASQHKLENNIWPACGHPELSRPNQLSGIHGEMTWPPYL